MPRALMSLVLSGALLLTSCQEGGRQTQTEAENQGISQPDFAPDVEAFVRDAMSRFETPGFTVGITRGGELVYTGAFGITNLETQEPLRPEHLFHMASVSKPFVATAVMQLVERGQMELDAPVTTYLPYFELADERYEEITIRQMLTHTSGMPDVADYEWERPQLDEGAAERYVRSLGTEKMLFAPGERYRYSNMAFDTLGDVIAKVSGQSFEAYMKENILDPLGMKESSFLQPETREELRTSGHVWKLGPVLSDVYPYNRRHAPSSTLNSNVVEMANWAFANLARGELDGKRILADASYDVLWQPAFEVGEDRHVGLSWFLGKRHGTPTVSHSGGDTGFTSYFILLPEKDVSVVCASNYSGGATGQMAMGIVDILLGQEPETLTASVAFSFAKVLADDGIEAAKAHYRRLESEARDEYSFGDGELNRLGYYFLGQDEVETAIDVFKFNVELYPEVGNTYDSLGESYIAAGQKEPAAVNYRKALELDPDNDNARRVLGWAMGVTALLTTACCPSARPDQAAYRMTSRTATAISWRGRSRSRATGSGTTRSPPRSSTTGSTNPGTARWFWATTVAGPSGRSSSRVTREDRSGCLPTRAYNPALRA